MTELMVTDGPGPRVHALVIGVGHYPYTGRGHGRGAALRLLDDLPAVTVPEPSATKIAQWLLATERSAPDPPMGTVDVLISPSPPSPGSPPERREPARVRLASGQHVNVESAAFDNLRHAFRRWRNRCDSHADNIALFYFCGHGWQFGEQLLLFEDLGANPDRLLENSVELGHIRALMRHARARTQIYFVDACRELPPDLISLGSTPGVLGDVPLLNGPLETIDSAVFFSTAPGHVAFGDPNAATPYTDALIASLDGLGARRDGTNWAVTSGSLAANLGRVIEWRRTANQRQQRLTIDNLSGQAVLRSLGGPPTVPFQLTCLPPQAPTPEAVSFHTLNGTTDGDAVHVMPGHRGTVTAGLYRIEAQYLQPSRYDATPVFEYVDAPYTIVTVTATKS
ncbi:caspase family protein [Streptomyces sp. IBSBF 2806]|uniref:caspase family protein n=1 Tax=Streptomyces sp. IBSBF 2806 TaxID=2903529 RepID=UPI002FDC0452